MVLSYFFAKFEVQPNPSFLSQHLCAKRFPGKFGLSSCLRVYFVMAPGSRLAGRNDRVRERRCFHDLQAHPRLYANSSASENGAEPLALLFVLTTHASLN